MVFMHSIADSWQIFPARQVENSADFGPLLILTFRRHLGLRKKIVCIYVRGKIIRFLCFT